MDTKVRCMRYFAQQALIIYASHNTLLCNMDPIETSLPSLQAEVQL